MVRRVVLSIFSLIISFEISSFATDTKGCLTCHRYPGLVKYEKPDSFKILHIDEEEHIKSSHGKIECNDCHLNVSKVPHTGNTDVNCTSKCHSQDKEKIDSLDSESLGHYHEKEKFAITELEDKTSCRICHPLYPHSENKKVRAFVNMHTGFMLCEVCHLRKENPKLLSYDWKSPDKFKFIGEPYGTHRESLKEEKTHAHELIFKMLKMTSPYDNHSKENLSKNNYIFRIAAYKQEDKAKKLLMNTDDCEKATEFLSKEKSMSADDRDQELKYFHRDIARKEISVACNECHSPNGILDFRKLGFEDYRAKDLQYMNIKSLLTKYDTFYFPNLFGR